MHNAHGSDGMAAAAQNIKVSLIPRILVNKNKIKITAKKKKIIYLVFSVLREAFKKNIEYVSMLIPRGGGKTAHCCPITLNNSYSGVPPAPGTGMGQSLEWPGKGRAAASNTEHCSSIN